MELNFYIITAIIIAVPIVLAIIALFSWMSLIVVVKLFSLIVFGDRQERREKRQRIIRQKRYKNECRKTN